MISIANNDSGFRGAGYNRVFGYGTLVHKDEPLITEANKEERTGPHRYVEYPQEIPVDPFGFNVDNFKVEICPEPDLMGGLTVLECVQGMVLAQNDGFRDKENYNGRCSGSDPIEKALQFAPHLRGTNFSLDVKVNASDDPYDDGLGTISTEQLFKAECEYLYGYEKQGPDPKYLEGTKSLLVKKPDAYKYEGIDAKNSGRCNGYNYYKNKNLTS